KIMAGIVFLVCLKVIISRPIVITIVKEKTSWINIPVCLQSEINTNHCVYFASFKMLATLVLIKSIATILLTPSGITISA
ncbi:hypothetical protein ACVR1K_10910, partial [Streptococcus agalactiae]